MIRSVPEMTTEDHYASAARRHYDDARYLCKRKRWPNADHHLGFAAECALKSLLLRYTEASMNPKPPKGKQANKPWIPKPTGGVQEYGHLPWAETELAVLATGRQGQHLLAALGDRLSAFANWTEQDRYHHCNHITQETVTPLHDATQFILALHESARITGTLEVFHERL